MNFTRELAEKILTGEKTVTRRAATDKPTSPWWRHRCRLTIGWTYAVCPGRGTPAVARIRVLDTRLETLGRLTDEEAVREGFATPAEFEAAWAAIKGAYDPDIEVWRVEFMLIPPDER